MKYTRMLGLVHIGTGLLFEIYQLPIVITLSSGIWTILESTGALFGFLTGLALARRSLAKYKIDGRLPFLFPIKYPTQQKLTNATQVPGSIFILITGIISVLFIQYGSTLPAHDILEELAIFCGTFFASTMISFGIRFTLASTN